MRLAYRKMPRILRLLTWLYLIHGCVRILTVLVGQFGEEPPSLSRIGFSIVYIWSAIRIRQGQREGVSWLLFTVLLQSAFVAWFLIQGTLPFDGLILAAIASLAASGGYLAWARFRLPWREHGSYGEWMSDPERAQDVSQWFALRDERVRLDREDPPDPDETVAELLDGAGVELTRQRLLAQPGHFGMAVFRALDNPAFRRHPEALIMLVRELPDSLVARSGARLSACLPHVPEEDRREVLRQMASSGDAGLGAELAKELLGEHGDYVGQGLDEAAKAGRLGDELFAAVEQPLWKCLEDPGKSAHAALVLVTRHPELPQRLVDDARELDERPLRALVELAEGKLPLPTAAMQTLWRTARDRCDWYWCWRLMEFVDLDEGELRDLLARAQEHFGDEQDLRNWTRENAAHYSRYAYTRALSQLCDKRVADAEQLLRTAIALELKHVSDDAASRLDEFLGGSDHWWFEDGGTTHRQQVISTLSTAMGYAGNGGLEHALMCLDDVQLPLLMEALDMIGPPEVRDIWVEAMREISPDPLPNGYEERRALIRSRYDDVEQRLDELSSKYFRCSWKQTVALHLYAIEHRDELKAE